jgi:hypothetical protein
MPVACMSMRLRMGCVNALLQPGSEHALVQVAHELVAGDGHKLGPHAPEQRPPRHRHPAHVPPSHVPGAPLRAGLEPHDGLEHRQGRRVGGALGAARLAEHRQHLGNLPQHRVLPLELPPRLLDGDARQRGGHVQHVALVERRHELRPNRGASGSADTTAITPMSTVVTGLRSATCTKGAYTARIARLTG